VAGKALIRAFPSALHANKAYVLISTWNEIFHTWEH
jgi:hypothetical protein